jgi:hypothetical protein
MQSQDFDLTQGVPQVFITHVLSPGDLPNVEILTIPNYPFQTGINDAGAVLQQLQIEGFAIRVEYFEADVRLETLSEGIAVLLRNGEFRDRIDDVDIGTTRIDNETLRLYAQQVVFSQPIPIMNSPISGSTLANMVGAGGGAAFITMFPHPDAGQIALYFLMLGGTRIVLGAADGVSLALREGLSSMLLKWMGVPYTTKATTRTRKPRRTQTL